MKDSKLILAIVDTGKGLAINVSPDSKLSPADILYFIESIKHDIMHGKLDLTLPEEEEPKEKQLELEFNETPVQ